MRRQLIFPWLATSALGILTAASLTTVCQVVAAMLERRSDAADAKYLTGGLLDVAQLAFWFGTCFAVFVSLFCVPIWVVLQRRGLNSVGAALCLGFIGVMIAWLSDGWDGVQSFPEAIASGLPFAICGALTGAVMWFAGPSRRSAKVTT